MPCDIGASAHYRARKQAADLSVSRLLTRGALPIKLIHYFPSVPIIVPLYKRLTINRAVGLVEILVYCRIGQSAIFGVILTFINPLFISLLLQVRERPHYAISRQ